MMKKHTRQEAFTLLEMAIATSVTLVAIAMALTGFAFALRSASQKDVQYELDLEVQLAMERIKRDLRLSTVAGMAYYPAGPGPYTGISFPMARDDDGDGAIEVDADGSVIWDRTLVYHVWTTEPHQLRLTVFDPRDNDLTAAERQEQLDSVFTMGHGNYTYNSDNAETRVVFENLFDWTITPGGPTFDGYSAETNRQFGVDFGSYVLTPGAHEFTFTVVDKNASSAGYAVGVDTLYASPSYGEREAEAQLDGAVGVGADPVAEYMPGGSWSGNYHLMFPARRIGTRFTIELNNDLWEETNFRGVGQTLEDTEVEFDQTLTPYDYVVKLDGLDDTWTAATQTGDIDGRATTPNSYTSAAVRVVMRGSEMAGGGWVAFDGGKSKFNFLASTNISEHFGISVAYIAEALVETSAVPDIVVGTAEKITFTGSTSVNVIGGSSEWSDLMDYPIDEEKSYVISYLVSDSGNHGNPWQWQELIDPSVPSSFVIMGSHKPGIASMADASWSARGDVIATNCVIGLQKVYTTYATNGVYTSAIYDTHVDKPTYTEIDWDAVVPSGASLTMKVRAGESSDLSDALDWSKITAMTMPGMIDPGTARYVQFQANLAPSSSGLDTPKLQDVAVSWVGETALTDISGTFTTGPDYGVVELEIDGNPLTKGLAIDLEIFKDAQGLGGEQRITSALSAEVSPRNNNK